ncbi:MAG: helix-turn-helix domain-containing protein [Tannerellaceae bacterium]|nr:helix-turn-helix domain-containing protein [Tannerellaceae bacterium]
MNSFFTLAEEPFLVGESDLHKFLHHPRRLDWGLLFLCTEGKAVISTETINYELRKHSKVTLLPGTIFTLHEASPGFQVSFLAFSHKMFDEANFRLGPSFFRFLRENPVYHLPADKSKLLQGLFPFLKTVYHDHANQFRYDIAKNQLQCLLWETYDKTHRHFQNMKEHSSYNQHEIFKKFISLLRTHYKEEREVSFYADQLCITPRYLSFITRQITQTKSAKEIINKHIILEIKVLLETTQLSIQEIANYLNFPDQSYLGRYFKRYTGKSPSEYRVTTSSES